jgi:hypothetical protein
VAVAGAVQHRMKVLGALQATDRWLGPDAVPLRLLVKALPRWQVR